VERPIERPKEEPKLAFDNAKHTVLAAIIGIGDQAEVWLHVRTTAQMLKLHEGDSFEIGSVKGIIREISEDEFVYESLAKANKGKHLKVSRGAILEQSTTLPVATLAPTLPGEKPALSESGKPESEPSESEKPEPAKTEVKTEAKPEATEPATGSEPKPSAEKSEPTETAGAVGQESQNHDDVILAASLPAGYRSQKRELQVMEQTANELTVFKEGQFSKVIVTRENRDIADSARLTAAMGYLNATFTATRDIGWTIKNKEVGRREVVDVSKPYAVQWEFTNGEGKTCFVDTKVIFTQNGYLIRIFSDDPEERKVLRAWVETIKPIPEK
jgi:hypothetical protein